MAKKTDKAKDKKKPVATKKKVAAKPKKAPAKAAAKKSAAKPKKAAAHPKKAASKKPAAAAVKKPAAKAPAKVAPKPAPKPVAAAKPAPKPAPEKVVRRAKEAPAPKIVAPAPDEDESLDEAPEAESEEVVLTDAEGRRYCRVKDCDQVSTVDGYCRFHYLLYWKKIQVRKKILTEGKLERYIEELTARYPDKFLDMLRKDLRSEKEFLAAIQELEIDESAAEGEFEDETQTYIEEVRGMGEGGSGREDEDF